MFRYIFALLAIVFTMVCKQHRSMKSRGCMGDKIYRPRLAKTRATTPAGIRKQQTELVAMLDKPKGQF